MTTLTYEDLKLPVYLNTRPLLANLTVTDAAIAAVLGKLGLLAVGDTGCGKSQLGQDIFDHYFGGNVAQGGQGIKIKAHPEIDIYNEIFTQLNRGTASRELTQNIHALLYYVDELNRAPPVSQNQFFGLGDGLMDYKGSSIPLGHDGYHMLFATANIGNGEFSGTFETDKAMYNRLHVVLDLDHYKPTREDKFRLNQGKADPNIKISGKRDISDSIIAASEKVSHMTVDSGLEAQAVIHYLSFGLDNCQKNNGSKGKVWPSSCQGCTYNPQDETLCAKIRAPVQRTLEATIKYAAALEFVAKLKDPQQSIDAVEFMFKAFELTGAYQSLLNPQTLRQKYLEQNPVMMATVAEELKKDFRANEDYILTSLEMAGQGKAVTVFFKDNETLGDYETLNRKANKKVAKLEPYTDARPIGLGWVKDLIQFERRKK